MPKPKGEPADNLHQEDYEILASWRYTLRLFLRFSEEAAAGEGLEPQQHQALLAIRGFPGREVVSIGELAERLQVRHHTAVGLVNRLEAAQLVQRRTAPDDKRKVLLALTPHARRILARLSTAHKRELRRLSPDFRTLLERLNAE